MRARVIIFALALPVLLATADAQVHSHNNIAHRRTPARTALAPLSPHEQAAQIVARFTFGPTPGMVEAVAAQGWQQWFDQQLRPNAIPDGALAKRLGNYPSLAMPPAVLAVDFPDGQVIRRIANGKQAMPADPKLAAVYQVMLARYQEKQAKDKADASAPANPGGANQPAAQADVQQTQAAEKADRQAQQARAAVLAGPVLALAPANRLNAVLALPVPDRLALTRGLADPLKTQMLAGVSARDREMWGIMAGGYGANGVVANELQQAKVLRATLSQRQLQDVMTDFWVNHFNIDLGKSGDELNYANQYVEDAIRAHALGKFGDLLVATAESPAMMIYLDNLTSIGPDSPAAGRQKKNGAHGGLNENYGREVMELHTLGVDGGYTQADVTALSSILTGWGVDQPQQGGPFRFQQRRHEPGNKQWLNHTVSENGQQEGIDALIYLANQPATARHLCFELAQRFVGDNPPPALVNTMVLAWTSTGGDISAVLEAMVHSPGFFNRANFHNKVKSPLEFVASALRATNTDPTNPGALVNQLQSMGEAPYRCQPPDGYAPTGAQWMNSAALVDRLNFALALSAGKLDGMRLDAPLLLATGLMEQPADVQMPRTHTVALELAPPQLGEDLALKLMEATLVDGEVSSQTNSVIRAQLAQRDPLADAADPAHALDTMAAMILGSPEFQVH